MYFDSKVDTKNPNGSRSPKYAEGEWSIQFFVLLRTAKMCTNIQNGRA